MMTGYSGISRMWNTLPGWRGHVAVAHTVECCQGPPCDWKGKDLFLFKKILSSSASNDLSPVVTCCQFHHDTFQSSMNTFTFWGWWWWWLWSWQYQRWWWWFPALHGWWPRRWGALRGGWVARWKGFNSSVSHGLYTFKLRRSEGWKLDFLLFIWYMI